VLRRALHRDECDQRRNRHSARRNHGRRVPAATGLDERKRQGGQHRRRTQRARDVYPALPRLPALVNDPPGRHEGRDHDRHVHEEDGAPPERCGESAAKQRADGQRQAPDARPHPYRARLLAGLGERMRTHHDERREADKVLLAISSA
jgi:hypothetical protein